ncbi:hypothetical protein GCM10007079_03050 [Nocardiopsis terrae]|uniref:DNA-binding protein n=1 Tax=Nocardiopsis terrae TaxID=372655 RepID=A0ABR9HMU8_9ACTN|nr:hypothetical protein [Nocardiopsis terrae]MBE1460356.1 hypothetical protein [Nocardiopsis terrae]GHC71013.1 hypothetical protein GCM10007079_03050 [Nocardiopsis terrae]
MPLPLPADPATSTLYLDWVRANAPECEPRALDLLDFLDERMRWSGLKPEYLQGAMVGRLRDAGLAVEHEPWLSDTVAHRLLRFGGKHATAAYLRARELESEHGLARDPHHTVENALLFARLGLLPTSEVSAHRHRLAEHRSAEEAHREFVRFLDAWATGGGVAAAQVSYPHTRASVGVAPPANLAAQIRASVKTLGLGKEASAEETSRTLGRYLAAARGNPVPDGLLKQAAEVFAKAPPAPEDRGGIAALFPTSVTDGAAWLRLLESAGIADAMADGRVRPDGGYSAWLSRFHHMYTHMWTRGCVGTQSLPDELFALLPRLAPRLRAENLPVRLFEGRYRHNRVDSRLLIACDDHRIPVDAPEEETRRIRRSVQQARNPRRSPSPEVVQEVEQWIEDLRSVPLGEAEHVLAELDLRLTHLVMGGMDGLQESLDGLDLAEPLARTLQFGIPAEHTWPAFEEAVEEVGGRPGGILGMTSTWPVLTVYGRGAAVAVDHQGRRGSCAFSLPEEAAAHVVHYVGGDFLVTWLHSEDVGSQWPRQPRAFWCSAPDDTFELDSDPGLFDYGSAHRYDLGLVLESPDRGRYDKERVLRPGDRTGVTYGRDHATDGTRVWTDGGRWEAGATELDPATGAALARSSPGFLTPDPRLDYGDLLSTRLHLVRLPEGVSDSPLGAGDGLAGARVVWIGPGAEGDRYAERALEGTDGRRAAFQEHRDLTYWGVLRMPDNPAEGLLAYRWQAGHTVIQCRDTTDDTLLWETWAYPKGGLKNLDLVGRRPLTPPPAYWHFLAPRAPESTRALRELDTGTARQLVEIALTTSVPRDPAPAVALPEIAEQVSRARAAAVREALPVLLPGVTEPAVADGVVWAVLWTVELRLKVAGMSDRTARIRSGTPPRPAGEAPDQDLAAAVSGLVPKKAFKLGFPTLPGMISSIAADGARLSGRASEEDRRLSPPGTPAASWTHFFGVPDAAMWRLATGALTGRKADALIALLRTWAGQPFAEQGTGWVLGTASGTALAPLLAQGEAVITEPPLDGQRYAHTNGKAPAPHWSDRYLPQRRYSYVRWESAPTPEGAEESEPLRIERDEVGRLRRFLDLLDRNGPVSAEPEAVKVFRKHTGVMKPVAEFVLSGQAGWPRSVPPTSKGAQTEYRKTGATLSEADTTRFLGAAVPDDPAELWKPGGTVAAAERMALMWVELLGVRPSKSDPAAILADLPALLQKEMDLGPEWAAQLTEPAVATTAAIEGSTDWSRSLTLSKAFGPLVHEPGNSERLHDFPEDEGTRPYLRTASLLAWALTELPVGHPAQARVAGLHERMTERLRSPDVYVPVVPHLQDGQLDGWSERVGAAEVRVGAEGQLEPGTGHSLHGDAILALPRSGVYRFPNALMLTSGLFEEEGFQRCTRALDEFDMYELALTVLQARVVCGGGLARMVERAADAPVPVGGFEVDPRLSAPELVAEVSGKFGVDAAASALYLQLLTLAHPTDRRVRRWNGWSAGQHQKAAVQLLENGLVTKGKRTKAGRTLFLPGGWTELKAPFPSMETVKLGTHLLAVDYLGRVRGTFSRPLPVAPPHEMFSAAWQSHSTG